MFQKARVPSWKRSFWPIVTSGSKILWAREFGAAAEFATERGRAGCFGLGYASGEMKRRRAMNHLPSVSTSVMVVASSMWEYA